MANSFISLLILLIPMIAGQGGNHLLDYVSSDAYWQNQNVEPSIDAMKKNLEMTRADIAPLLKKLASVDPDERQQAANQIIAVGVPALASLDEASRSPDAEVAAAAQNISAAIRSKSHVQSVKRLLAIRTLGELNDPAALPILQPLLQSKTPFESEYAQRAIDVIGNKTLHQIDPKQRLASVGLMPADARIVAQLNLFNKAFKIEDFIGKTGPIAGMTRRNAIKSFTTQITKIAEQVGDIRVDSVNLSVAGKIGRDEGWFLLDIQGQFDSKNVLAFIRKNYLNDKQNEANPNELIHDKSGTVLVLNDNHVLISAYASEQQSPVAGYIKTLDAGIPVLGADPDFKPLLAQTKPGQMLWGIVKMTDSYTVINDLRPFDLIRLSTETDGEKYSFSIVGDAKDQPSAAVAAQSVNGMMTQVKQELDRAMGNAGFDVGPFKKILGSVVCKSDKTQVKIGAEIEESDIISLTSILDLVLTGRTANMAR